MAIQMGLDGGELGGRSVTMRMIAKEADVSLATVSYALKRDPKVSVSTRTMIEAIARDMGYMPNPLIRQGMEQIRRAGERQVTSTMAYLSFEPINELLHHRRLLGACREKARALGYQIEPFQLNSSAHSNARLAQVLQARGIKGLLLAPSKDLVGAFSFPWELFASVELGYSIGSVRHHRVSLDYWQILTESLARLNQAGYSRIAFVGKEQDIRRTDYRYEASYLLHQKELTFGSILLPHYVCEVLEKPAFYQWLANARPDVIISQDNYLLEWLKQADTSSTGAVDFCSLLIQEPLPEVSGMLVSLASTSEAAVDFLARRLEKGDFGLPEPPIRLSISSRWQRGTTLRKGKCSSNSSCALLHGGN